MIITVGTGIGGGVVIDGRIFRGGSGGAGELGMTLIGLAASRTCRRRAITSRSGDRSRRCPRARRSIASPARRALRTRIPHWAGWQPPGTRCSARMRVAAARDGTRRPNAAVRRWAHALGVGIANAINTFDPDEVVIGGGGAAAGELLLDPAAEFAAGYVHPGCRGARRSGSRAGARPPACWAPRCWRYTNWSSSDRERAAVDRGPPR